MIMEHVKRFINLPYHHHLWIGFAIRLILIVYGDFHDKHFDVPYTDVDYKVFTDAARHAFNWESPYNRHTYRYSPFIAYLLIPNIVIGRLFGKILFSTFDILITVAIKKLVEQQLDKKEQGVSKLPVQCALFWIYNPMSIAISTRGNADSFPCFFIVLALLFLQTDVQIGNMKYGAVGSLLGFAIHLRLYPLAFSFPFYLSLGEYRITRSTDFKTGIRMLMPNKNQLVLVFSCVFTLACLTYDMYLLYDYEFLFETYLYHLFRRDVRHNFSVLFYYSYLTSDTITFDLVKTLTQLFELTLLFIVSLAFGCEKRTLNFAVFCQAVIMVTFNSVMTSQYFIWFLSLLPLVVHNFRMKLGNVIVMVLVWVATQGAWLFHAYMLEFQGRDVFLWIWLKCLLFFCANIYILGQLISSFSPDYAFGQNMHKNK